MMFGLKEPSDSVTRERDGERQRQTLRQTDTETNRQ